MPAHLKPCNICREPFAAGETRQPHPNADNIGYCVVHKRCAARLTRKGQAAAARTVLGPEPPPVVSVPQDETTQAPPVATHKEKPTESRAQHEDDPKPKGRSRKTHE